MLEFHPFYIGKLVGLKEEYANVDGSPAIGDALRVLADAERETIVKALLAHYGDEYIAFFIALWRRTFHPVTVCRRCGQDEAEWEDETGRSETTDQTL